MGGYKKEHTYGGGITLVMAKTALAMRKHGDTTQAALELGITREAVVSAVRHLEVTLKHRLFSRRPGRNSRWQVLAANQSTWERIQLIAMHHELQPIEVSA